MTRTSSCLCSARIRRLVSFLAFVQCALVCSAAFCADQPKPLQIYFVDVEGGQSTLFVTPEGQSLLVDTGWPGNNSRDADRIVAAAKSAGLSKIDFVLLTHYHTDHAGGVPQLAERIPIGAFVDHGENRETEPGATADVWNAYQKVLVAKRIKRITAKPGDVLPMSGMQVRVVSADGATLEKPLEGAGAPNDACKDTKPIGSDASENARSLGTLMTFGKLRVLDLGDLTWDKEIQLMCPANPLGLVDLFVVSHHGSANSDSPALVNAIQARVAIMDNGETKGGSASAWRRVRSAPRLGDLWQLHKVGQRNDGDAAENTPDSFIANLYGPDAGNFLKVLAWRDGSFDVGNPRTGATKHYAPKP